MSIKSVRKFIDATDSFMNRYLPNRGAIAEGDKVIEEFPWISEYIENIDEIYKDADVVLDNFKKIPTLSETATVGAGGQKGNEAAVNWKIYPFMLMHREINGDLASPTVRRLLDKSPGVVNAFFSILPPDSNLAPHHGTSRALVRCHIGLRTPKESEKCYFKVDDTQHIWQKGSMFLFDQTFLHSAVNATDEYRTILILDIERKEFPFLLRKTVHLVTYLIGFLKETRQTVKNYRKALVTQG